MRADWIFLDVLMSEKRMIGKNAKVGHLPSEPQLVYQQ